MAPFYKKLLHTNSLDEAMCEVASELKQFHAERFFYLTFAKYMKRERRAAHFLHGRRSATYEVFQRFIRGEA